MSTNITDKDVLAFVDAAKKETGAMVLTVWSGSYEASRFVAYPKGDDLLNRRVEGETVAEIKAKLAEISPEKCKRQELAELRAEVAKLEKELEGSES